jgi:ATP-dependent DNA helicase RecG
MAYTKKRVTVKELCDYLGRAPKTLQPVLRRLVDKGMLRWHGSGPWDPSQYYALD